MAVNSLEIKKHIACHKRFLSILPSKYESEDSNKLAIIYFSLSSLSLLTNLNSIFEETEIKKFIKFIYLHLIEAEFFSGFSGSLNYSPDENSLNIASTYFALLSLIILGDDLKRINCYKVMNFVKDCQSINGGFGNGLNARGEIDLRSCMFAISIRKIIKWDHFKKYKNNQNHNHNDIDIEGLKFFIYDTQCYDGGFGLDAGDESHAGLTFCGINSLSILNDLNSIKLEKLLDFLVHRQISYNKSNKKEFMENEYSDINDNGGFNGRLNKYGDTCYAFWCIASLNLLNKKNLIDKNSVEIFLIDKTQNLLMGGFNKTTDVDEFPDPLHSFLGLAVLSILDSNENLKKFNCELVVPHEAYNHWKNISFNY